MVSRSRIRLLIDGGLFLRREDPPQRHGGDNDKCGDGTKPAEARRQRIYRQTDDIPHAELDLFPFLAQDQDIHNMEGDTGKCHIRKVHRKRDPRSGVFPDPRRREGDQGNDKKPHDICPKDLEVHLFGDMEHKVVIHPVDRHEKETQHIGKQGGQDRRKVFDPIPQRQAQFEHHNGDDNGKHAIAECF